MRVKNCAGLFVELQSPPVLIDRTTPQSGVVKDGPDFLSDVLWVNDNTKVTGSCLLSLFIEKKYIVLFSISHPVSYQDTNINKRAEGPRADIGQGLI